ncbi:hypothetical protein JTB14_001419 [Gonioctena quinquepunctata]|nr:hypothetical protein JTB14_001419 [Gonioctena quinquepunctata]
MFYLVFVLVTFLLYYQGKDHQRSRGSNNPSRGHVSIDQIFESSYQINESTANDTVGKYVPKYKEGQKSDKYEKALSVLYLIEKIDENTFSLFRNIRVINLSENHLKSLSSYTFWNQINLESLFLINNSLSLIEGNAFNGLFNIQRLYLDFNKLEDLIEDFQILTSLKSLSLSHNRLSLEINTFPAMPSLEELYLDNNNIKTITENVFQNLTKVRKISLGNNQIASIDPGAFHVLNDLIELNLYKNCITRLMPSTFTSQQKLIGLYLGYNPLKVLPSDTFKNLSKLQYLNLEDINLSDIDSSIPTSDGISSVNNLLNKRIFRCWNWMISSTICVGNLLVIFSRVMFRDENKILSLVIRNLAASDFLMGIYLLVIGVHDVKFRDIYNEKAEQWMSSWTCTLTGITGMVSSEVTVFILIFISIDRFLMIISNYSGYRSLNSKDTVIVLAIIWCLGIAVAVIPAIRYVNDFRFYGINGLCFPLHIAYPFYTGWQYTAFIIFGINATSLIIIAVLYVGMFISIRKTREATPLPRKVYEFVFRFFFIVFIYALCWLPIILFKTAAYAGAEISEELYGWLVVFILPINSASNPILYTFTTPKYRAKMKISCIFEKVLDKKLQYDIPSVSSERRSDCFSAENSSTDSRRF